MVALMLLLAAMMSSTVPYPAWPKVGVRSWRAVAGLLGVIGIVTAAILFTKYFFFLFGVAYVSYGLLRALFLAAFELPDGEPRRRSTDYVDPLESYGMRSDEHEAPALMEADGARFGRRRRRRRRHGGSPSQPPSGHTPPE